jgi:hypothetical protein
MSENEIGTLVGTIYITYGLKGTALYFFEQDRRASLLKNAPVDFRHFEIGINFFFDAQQLAVFFKVIYTGAQAGVTHGYIGLRSFGETKISSKSFEAIECAHKSPNKLKKGAKGKSLPSY